MARLALPGHRGHQRHTVRGGGLRQPEHIALGAVPLLLAVAVLAFAARQPVIGRGSRHINRPVLIATIATNIAGVVVYQSALPQHFTGGLLALAIAMQVPLLAGAWLWLRR